MSLKARLMRLERELCPPGKCPLCSMDEKPSYANVLVFACSEQSCRCHDATDVYDPTLFHPGMYPLSPSCIRCRQHRGLHDLQCRAGYEDRQEQKAIDLQPGMGKR